MKEKKRNSRRVSASTSKNSITNDPSPAAASKTKNSSKKSDSDGSLKPDSNEKSDRGLSASTDSDASYKRVSYAYKPKNRSSSSDSTVSSKKLRPISKSSIPVTESLVRDSHVSKESLPQVTQVSVETIASDVDDQLSPESSTSKGEEPVQSTFHKEKKDHKKNKKANVSVSTQATSISKEPLNSESKNSSKSSKKKGGLKKKHCVERSESAEEWNIDSTIKDYIQSKSIALSEVGFDSHVDTVKFLSMNVDKKAIVPMKPIPEDVLKKYTVKDQSKTTVSENLFETGALKYFATTSSMNVECDQSTDVTRSEEMVKSPSFDSSSEDTSMHLNIEKWLETLDDNPHRMSEEGSGSDGGLSGSNSSRDSPTNEKVQKIKGKTPIFCFKKQKKKNGSPKKVNNHSVFLKPKPTEKIPPIPEFPSLSIVDPHESFTKQKKPDEVSVATVGVQSAQDSAVVSTKEVTVSLTRLPQSMISRHCMRKSVQICETPVSDASEDEFQANKDVIETNKELEEHRDNNKLFYVSRKKNACADGKFISKNVRKLSGKKSFNSETTYCEGNSKINLNDRQGSENGISGIETQVTSIAKQSIESSKKLSQKSFLMSNHEKEPKNKKIISDSESEKRGNSSKLSVTTKNKDHHKSSGKAQTMNDTPMKTIVSNANGPSHACVNFSIRLKRCDLDSEVPGNDLDHKSPNKKNAKNRILGLLNIEPEQRESLGLISEEPENSSPKKRKVTVLDSHSDSDSDDKYIDIKRNRKKGSQDSEKKNVQLSINKNFKNQKSSSDIELEEDENLDPKKRKVSASDSSSDTNSGDCQDKYIDMKQNKKNGRKNSEKQNVQLSSNKNFRNQKNDSDIELEDENSENDFSASTKKKDLSHKKKHKDNAKTMNRDIEGSDISSSSFRRQGQKTSESKASQRISSTRKSRSSNENEPEKRSKVIGSTRKSRSSTENEIEKGLIVIDETESSANNSDNGNDEHSDVEQSNTNRSAEENVRKRHVPVSFGVKNKREGINSEKENVQLSSNEKFRNQRNNSDTKSEEGENLGLKKRKVSVSDSSSDTDSGDCQDKYIDTKQNKKNGRKNSEKQNVQLSSNKNFKNQKNSSDIELEEEENSDNDFSASTKKKDLSHKKKHKDNAKTMNRDDEESDISSSSLRQDQKTSESKSSHRISSTRKSSRLSKNETEKKLKRMASARQTRSSTKIETEKGSMVIDETESSANNSDNDSDEHSDMGQRNTNHSAEENVKKRNVRDLFEVKNKRGRMNSEKENVQLSSNKKFRNRKNSSDIELEEEENSDNDFSASTKKKDLSHKKKHKDNAKTMNRDDEESDISSSSLRQDQKTSESKYCHRISSTRKSSRLSKNETEKKLKRMASARKTRSSTKIETEKRSMVIDETESSANNSDNDNDEHSDMGQRNTNHSAEENVKKRNVRDLFEVKNKRGGKNSEKENDSLSSNNKFETQRNSSDIELEEDDNSDNDFSASTKKKDLSHKKKHKYDAKTLNPEGSDISSSSLKGQGQKASESKASNRIPSTRKSRSSSKNETESSTNNSNKDNDENSDMEQSNKDRSVGKNFKKRHVRDLFEVKNKRGRMNSEKENVQLSSNKKFRNQRNDSDTEFEEEKNSDEDFVVALQKKDLGRKRKMPLRRSVTEHVKKKRNAEIMDCDTEESDISSSSLERHGQKTSESKTSHKISSTRKSRSSSKNKTDKKSKVIDETETLANNSDNGDDEHSVIERNNKNRSVEENVRKKHVHEWFEDRRGRNDSVKQNIQLSSDKKFKNQKNSSDIELEDENLGCKKGKVTILDSSSDTDSGDCQGKYIDIKQSKNKGKKDSEKQNVQLSGNKNSEKNQKNSSDIELEDDDNSDNISASTKKKDLSYKKKHKNNAKTINRDSEESDISSNSLKRQGQKASESKASNRISSTRKSRSSSKNGNEKKSKVNDETESLANNSDKGNDENSDMEQGNKNRSVGENVKKRHVCDLFEVKNKRGRMNSEKENVQLSSNKKFRNRRNSSDIEFEEEKNSDDDFVVALQKKDLGRKKKMPLRKSVAEHVKKKHCAEIMNCDTEGSDISSSSLKRQGQETSESKTSDGISSKKKSESSSKNVNKKKLKLTDETESLANNSDNGTVEHSDMEQSNKNSDVEENVKKTLVRDLREVGNKHEARISKYSNISVPSDDSSDILTAETVFHQETSRGAESFASRDSDPTKSTIPNSASNLQNLYCSLKVPQGGMMRIAVPNLFNVFNMHPEVKLSRLNT